MNGVSFIARGGTILGRDHAQRGKNSQDGFAIKTIQVEGQEIVVAVVSDGCSGSTKSEVAANLLPAFATNYICQLLTFSVPISQIPTALYPAVVSYLRNVASQVPFAKQEELVDFVKNYLLATIVGCLVSENESVIFHAGDGIVAINDDITVIDYDDKSPYVAYHLVPETDLVVPKVSRPNSFTTVPVNNFDLKNITIASDGFTPGLLQRMWQEAKLVPLGIQLWMNWVNGPRNPKQDRGIFADDATVVSIDVKGVK